MSLGALTTYLTGIPKRDYVLNAFGVGAGAQSRQQGSSLVGGVAGLIGFEDDHLDKMVHCWKNNLPFFHIDHSYFKRGYRKPPEHGNFRVNFRHFHQTGLFELPPDRADRWRDRVKPWKKDGRTVVIVTPSARVCRVLGSVGWGHIHPEDWTRQMEAKLRKYTGRPLFVKTKGEGFAGTIENAWAVVSLSSVAETEAAMAGVPVFVSKHSPANQVGLSLDDLERIDEPVYPDREQWLRTLSYSQFNTEEMASGMAWRLLKELYGDHHSR